MQNSNHVMFKQMLCVQKNNTTFQRVNKIVVANFKKRHGIVDGLSFPEYLSIRDPLIVGGDIGKYRAGGLS